VYIDRYRDPMASVDQQPRLTLSTQESRREICYISTQVSLLMYYSLLSIRIRSEPEKCILIWCLFLKRAWLGTCDRR
jgi:hypothetical protein